MIDYQSMGSLKKTTERKCFGPLVGTFTRKIIGTPTHESCGMTQNDAPQCRGYCQYGIGNTLLVWVYPENFNFELQIGES